MTDPAAPVRQSLLDRIAQGAPSLGAGTLDVPAWDGVQVVYSLDVTRETGDRYEEQATQPQGSRGQRRGGQTAVDVFQASLATLAGQSRDVVIGGERLGPFTSPELCDALGVGLYETPDERAREAVRKLYAYDDDVLTAVVDLDAARQKAKRQQRERPAPSGDHAAAVEAANQRSG